MGQLIAWQHHYHNRRVPKCSTLELRYAILAEIYLAKLTAFGEGVAGDVHQLISREIDHLELVEGAQLSIVKKGLSCLDWR
jgi:hypothetical protein